MADVLKTCAYCGLLFGPGKWPRNFINAKFCGLACSGAGRKYTPEKMIAAFWAKVDRTGGPDACWPWIAAHAPSGGYGRFLYNHRLTSSHRVAYLLTHGELSPALDVIHSCDNPPCCNPKHLKAATTLENMHDCIAKGRAGFSGRKLDEDKAREILSLKGVIRAQDVEMHYGVTISTVHSIWTGKTWKQLQVSQLAK